MVPMAQYLFSVLDHATNSSTGDEDEAIDVFNDKLRAGGHWVFAGGLGGPDTSTVTDGPYLESKEYVAGFWIVNAPDLDVALRLAAEGSQACNRRVEVRPFLEV